MDARTKRRKEYRFEDGTIVGYRLPWIADCLMLGDVPMPAVEEAAKQQLLGEPTEAATAQAELELSAFQATRRFHDALVMQMVLDIDGEDVTITESAQLRDLFEEEQFQTLRDLATRTKDAEGKAPGPASSGSPTQTRGVSMPELANGSGSIRPETVTTT